MHFLPDIFLIKWLIWFPVLGVWSNSGGNSSNPQTHTETSTTSGSGSPSATGDSQAVGTGSIGVGSGGKYLEAGATDLAGAGQITGSNFSASSGSTINVGSPQAVDALSQAVQALANSPAANGGGGSTTVLPGGGGTSFLAPLTQNINWTLIAIIAAGAFLLWSIFGSKKTA